MSLPQPYKGTHSLDNFNPFARSEPLLDSPRSLEACKRQGIDPKELVPMSMEDCRKHLGAYTDDLVKIYYEAAEERRKYKLKLVSEERNRLLPDQQMETEGRARPVSARPVAADMEERRVLATRRRQEHEMRQAAEKQRIYQETLARNQAREEQIAQREALRRQELAETQREREQRRQAEEAKKRKEEKEAEILVKQRKQAQFEQEMERLRQTHLSKKHQKAALKRQTSEQRLKRAAFEASTQAKLAFQAQVLSSKRAEMEKRDLERKVATAKLQSELQAQSRARSFEKSRKIQAAKENLTSLLQASRLQFEEKQQTAAQKLAAVNSARIMAQRTAQQRAEEKQRTIEQVLEANKQITSLRKKAYLEEMSEADKRLQSRARDREKQRKEAAAWELKRGEMRRLVRDRMENIKETHKKQVLSKLDRNEQAVAQFKQTKSQRIRYLHIINTIKHETKGEEVRRIARKQAYHQHLLEKKLRSDDLRVREFQLKQEYQKRAKLKLRSDLERHKGQIGSLGGSYRGLSSASTRTLPTSPAFSRTPRPNTASNVRLRFPPTYSNNGYSRSKAPFLLLV